MGAAHLQEALLPPLPQRHAAGVRGDQPGVWVALADALPWRDLAHAVVDQHGPAALVGERQRRGIAVVVQRHGMRAAVAK